MSPAMNRRGFAKAGAAALGTAVTGISVAAQAAAADPDAALVALIARHGEAMAALDEIDAAALPLLDRVHAEAPAWLAEHHAFVERIGLTAANDACDRQSDVVSEIEMAICDYVPTTLDGLRCKARWIASSPQADEWAAILLRDLCGATS